MKQVIKWVAWGSIFVWVIVITFGVGLVISRQKRFEEATIAEVEFLMQELSLTNINASAITMEIESILEKQNRILDQLTEPSSIVYGGRCGEKEGKK